jgi:hypothetical protein
MIWYVSPGAGGGEWAAGSDDNDGSSRQAPFLTFQKAAAIAAVGDTIVIGKGSHRAPGLEESVELAKSKKIQFVIL